MLLQGATGSTLSSSVTLVVLILVSSGLSPIRPVAGLSRDIVNTFFDWTVQSLNHLVVHNSTGQVYVGGFSKLHQLSPNLEPVAQSNTAEDAANNVNKVLVIDYATPRLIACGHLFGGRCTSRSLQNISEVIQDDDKAVVTSDAKASTVAFIAPGLSDPYGPPPPVLYVGVSPTANADGTPTLPIVSSRSLDKRLNFKYVDTTQGAGTKIIVRWVFGDPFQINYVHGFSSEGFSYFVTTQPKDGLIRESNFTSRLVRICQNDRHFISYAEIPMSCINGTTDYNLVQAAYVGKAGSDLAKELGITTKDDVLFAVFSTSDRERSTPNTIMAKSALCVYPLKAIRKKFSSNIARCYAGNGTTGLDHVKISRQCTHVPLMFVADDFCGFEINAMLEGPDPIAATPLLLFDEHLTAVAATSTGTDTVVFVGTNYGFLKKIVILNATSALIYAEEQIDHNSPVNPDMHFDSNSMHLYAMTRHKVSKVKVADCSSHKSCSDCVTVKDPYCGWCALQKKCVLKNECDTPDVPATCITYNKGNCSTTENAATDE